MRSECKYDIVALGESLVDFVQTKGNGLELSFSGNAGGAPANLLTAAGKFGMKCAFIGKVGDDIFGHRLKKVYKAAGIDVDSMVFSSTEHTSLAFVTLDEDGDRSFFFYRSNTADGALTKEDVNLDVVESTRVFHFGSISMTTPSAYQATIYAVNAAKESGALISFDPNYRAPLWHSEDEAKKAFAEGCRLADIVKISDNEIAFLSDYEQPEVAAQDILDKFDCSLVVVTMGKNGAVGACASGLSAVSKAHEVDTVDTTGAGDAFFGAFLSGIVKSGKNPECLNQSELTNILNTATACGSLSTAAYGAIPSMPSQEEVMKLLGAG